jgi:hypothetical protein
MKNTSINTHSNDSADHSHKDFHCIYSGLPSQNIWLIVPQGCVSHYLPCHVPFSWHSWTSQWSMCLDARSKVSALASCRPSPAVVNICLSAYQMVVLQPETSESEALHFVLSPWEALAAGFSRLGRACGHPAYGWWL